MGKEDERVLVVPEEIVNNQPHGLSYENVRFLEKLLADERNRIFKRRGDVEDDPSWKQVIPYLVFEHNDKYFLMQRSDQGGETRLHNIISLGIGGHLNREDTIGPTIFDWSRRELAEEVLIRGAYRPEVLGLIYDHTTNKDGSIHVSQVHLGYAVLIHGSTAQIKIKGEHRSGRLVTLAECQTHYDQMETWSKFIVDYLNSAVI